MYAKSLPSYRSSREDAFKWYVESKLAKYREMIKDLDEKIGLPDKSIKQIQKYLDKFGEITLQYGKEIIKNTSQYTPQDIMKEVLSEIKETYSHITRVYTKLEIAYQYFFKGDYIRGLEKINEIIKIDMGLSGVPAVVTQKNRGYITNTNTLISVVQNMIQHTNLPKNKQRKIINYIVDIEKDHPLTYSDLEHIVDALVEGTPKTRIKRLLREDIKPENISEISDIYEEAKQASEEVSLSEIARSVEEGGGIIPLGEKYIDETYKRLYKGDKFLWETVEELLTHEEDWNNLF